MNMFAKFDAIPAMTLQDIRATKRYRQTYKRENSIQGGGGGGGGGGGAIIMTKASTVFKISTFQQISHLNALESKIRP